MTRLLVLIAASVVLLGLGGCGSGSAVRQSSQRRPGPAAKPQAAAPAPNALTEGQVVSVRLGTPIKTVLRRLGTPSGTGPRTVGRDRCRYWQITGQPPSTALWRLCFRSGRLDVMSTYLV